MFRDRADAGERLGQALRARVGDDLLVLGIPRGGVSVAVVVATYLRVPVDVVLVRKLGVPWHPELAMGAIGEFDVKVLDQETIRRAGVTDAQLDEVERRERAELDRRVRLLRGGSPAVSIRDRAVVIVDDGMATGSTVLAACRVVEAGGAAGVTVAVPVASRRAVDLVSAVADEVVCLRDPRRFEAVGQWYDDFRQVTDDEVVALLRDAGG